MLWGGKRLRSVEPKQGRSGLTGRAAPDSQAPKNSRTARRLAVVKVGVVAACGGGPRP